MVTHSHQHPRFLFLDGAAPLLCRCARHTKLRRHHRRRRTRRHQLNNTVPGSVPLRTVLKVVTVTALTWPACLWSHVNTAPVTEAVDDVLWADGFWYPPPRLLLVVAHWFVAWAGENPRTLTFARGFIRFR